LYIFLIISGNKNKETQIKTTVKKPVIIFFIEAGTAIGEIYFVWNVIKNKLKNIYT